MKASLSNPRRGSNLFIPRSETILKAGDMLVFVAEGEARNTVLELCKEKAVQYRSGLGCSLEWMAI